MLSVTVRAGVGDIGGKWVKLVGNVVRMGENGRKRV